MVRLKDLEDVTRRLGMTNFNSNMVRLKVINVVTLTSAITFQFQHGTIKSLKKEELIEAVSEISIPTWYD